MYDGLMTAVENLDPLTGRKAIIVLTDGLDNRSVSSSEEVLQAIGPSGLTISTIGLGDPTHGKGAQTALDEHALIALAGDAGGVYAYAEDEESLLEVYERYARTLQAEYSLTYTSPATVRDGVNRSLSISFAGESVETGVGQYNPGGIVPEAADPVSWSLFLTLLVILLILLALPMIVRVARSLLSRGEKRKPLNIKLGSRVKLKD
jgi:hypothetical protein